MNNFFTFLCSAVLLISFPGQQLNAAGDDQHRTYRVTGHKKGNNKIISQSNEAKVIPPFNIYVPNAITPNGDGLNDRFRAEGEGIGHFKMQIFNRWGEIVFETDSPTEGWDGKFRGVLFPNTVYKYIISAKGIHGGSAYLDGNVTVLQ